MGSEREADEASSTLPKLRLPFSIPAMESPLHSAAAGGGEEGMLTPLHTSASVPFQWEEEPGKPRPCTALIPAVSDPNTTTTTTKSLELPPRLQSMESSSKLTKMPSPTTVLDGPYYAGMSSIFQSSSFRFISRERQGSFGSSCGSPERGQLGAMVLRSKDRSGFFGSWRRKPPHRHRRGKKEVGEGSFVFSSSMDFAVDFGGGGGGGGGGVAVVDESSAGPSKEMSSRIRRNGSFSNLSQIKPRFWATIYEGFKQVLPWKNRKSKKEGLLI